MKMTTDAERLADCTIDDGVGYGYRWSEDLKDFIPRTGPDRETESGEWLFDSGTMSDIADAITSCERDLRRIDRVFYLGLAFAALSITALMLYIFL